MVWLLLHIPILFRITSLVLGQSYYMIASLPVKQLYLFSYPGYFRRSHWNQWDSPVIMKDMDLISHYLNTTKHIKAYTVCITKEMYWCMVQPTKYAPRTRNDSTYTPSRWGTTLQCNVVSLGWLHVQNNLCCTRFRLNTIGSMSCGNLSFCKVRSA